MVERSDFEQDPSGVQGESNTDGITRADDSFEEDDKFDDESSEYVPLTEEQVGNEIHGMIGGLMRKQT